MNRGLAIVALLALSIGLNIGLLYWVASPPLAGRRAPGGGPGNLDRVLNNHLERMADGLELDDAQRQAISEVLDQYIPLVLAQSERVKAARRELAETYRSNQWSAETFRAAVAGLHEEQAELDRLVGEAMIGEASVLTEEQRRRYVRGSPWSALIGADDTGPGDRGGPGRRPPPKKQR